MESNHKVFKYRRIETITPSFFRSFIKKIYWRIIRINNKYFYINKGRFVEFGYRFRFTRRKPYYAHVGQRTIVEDFNVWNGKNGNIVIGEGGWIGLHNIITGPIEIGNELSTGPFVSILGPRHPVMNSKEKKEKTIIGNNCWIGTGSIVMYGVKMGDNSIIGAGSVVTKDVPPDSFFAGNPARDITRLANLSWQKSEMDNGH